MAPPAPAKPALVKRAVATAHPAVASNPRNTAKAALANAEAAFSGNVISIRSSMRNRRDIRALELKVPPLVLVIVVAVSM